MITPLTPSEKWALIRGLGSTQSLTTAVESILDKRGDESDHLAQLLNESIDREKALERQLAIRRFARPSLALIELRTRATPRLIGALRKVGRGRRRHPETTRFFETVADFVEETVNRLTCPCGGYLNIDGDCANLDCQEAT